MRILQVLIGRKAMGMFSKEEKKPSEVLRAKRGRMKSSRSAQLVVY